jgi:ribosome-binding factor A
MKKQNLSHRQQKAASLINAAIVQALQKGSSLDHRLIGCPVTITAVKVTADLKLAHCYFLPFNTKLKENELLEALNNSKYAIRAFVTKEVKLKFSPEIRFHFDHGFDYMDKIQSLLKVTSPPRARREEPPY